MALFNLNKVSNLERRYKYLKGKRNRNPGLPFIRGIKPLLKTMNFSMLWDSFPTHTHTHNNVPCPEIGCDGEPYFLNLHIFFNIAYFLTYIRQTHWRHNSFIEDFFFSFTKACHKCVKISCLQFCRITYVSHTSNAGTEKNKHFRYTYKLKRGWNSKNQHFDTFVTILKNACKFKNNE